MLTVEKEAAVGGPLEPAEAEPGLHFVDHLAAFDQTELDGVEVGMIGVPEHWIADNCVLPMSDCDARHQEIGHSLLVIDLHSVGAGDTNCHLKVASDVRIVSNLRDNLQLRALS